MRKALVIVLIAVFSLSMLAFAGCGGDKNKETAKEHMQAGDRYLDAVATSWTGLEEKQTDLATAAMAGDFSAVTGAAGEALQAEIEATFAKMAGDMDAAEKEYKAIAALEGVQDYKDYADLKMQQIDVLREQLETAQKLVADLSQSLAAMAAGQDIDFITQMMESPELAKISELADKADGLEEQAEQIKKDKKLEK